eukprot:1453645-Rhodomonas_salina.1
MEDPFEGEAAEGQVTVQVTRSPLTSRTHARTHARTRAHTISLSLAGEEIWISGDSNVEAEAWTWVRKNDGASGTPFPNSEILTRIPKVRPPSPEP